MRITFDPPKPGDGCPGGVMLNCRPVPMCLLCARIGGRELEPAVRVVRGGSSCLNFHPLSVSGRTDAAQTAEVGGTPEGAVSAAVQTEAMR